MPDPAFSQASSLLYISESTYTLIFPKRVPIPMRVLLNGLPVRLMRMHGVRLTQRISMRRLLARQLSRHRLGPHLPRALALLLRAPLSGIATEATTTLCLTLVLGRNDFRELILLALLFLRPS